MLGVGSAHTQRVRLIQVLPVPLTRGLHVWPRLPLSPGGKGGSAGLPQATFLSLTNEDGWPWVVTDTDFQLLTKTPGWASGYTATQWPAPSQVSCEQVRTPPQASRSCVQFPHRGHGTNGPLKDEQLTLLHSQVHTPHDHPVLLVARTLWYGEGWLPGLVTGPQLR